MRILLPNDEIETSLTPLQIQLQIETSTDMHIARTHTTGAHNYATLRSFHPLHDGHDAIANQMQGQFLPGDPASPSGCTHICVGHCPHTSPPSDLAPITDNVETMN